MEARLRSLLIAAVFTAAFAMVTPALAIQRNAVARTASFQHWTMCSAQLPPTRELSCASYHLKHARNVLSFLDKFPQFGTRDARARVRRNHLWLRRFALNRIAEAKQRLFPVAVTRDWYSAVEYVQRWYPGSSGWLMSCSASEGGHGVWVWNGGAPYGSSHSGSDAGGWMQYFEGTWRGDFDAAVRDLASRGVTVPAASRSWLSPLGQAIAAGWAYAHDRPSGKWLGGGC